MKKILLFILCIAPLSLYADQVSLPFKSLIENFNLEEQTIQLNGQKYKFSNKVIITDSNGTHLGFQALNIGQMIQFNTISSQDSTTSSDEIAVIKLITDNRSSQSQH